MRKCYLKPQFDDNFSTFHFKTAIMFTIESHLPDIWQKDNIVACTTYCLNTLLRWIKRKYCPHFTTKGVNLFDGKLSRHQLQLLESVLREISSNIVWYICNLEMDQFGLRILDKFGIRVLPLTVYYFKNGKEIQRDTVKSVLGMIIANYGIDLASHRNQVNPHNEIARVIRKLQHLLTLQNTGSDLECEAAILIIPYLQGTLATIKASLCIASNQPVTRDIHQLYSLSFDSDLMSGKLKYASMLYCIGQYTQAADVLTHCEGLLRPDVFHYCGCAYRGMREVGDGYLEKMLNLNTVDLRRSSTTTCVKFTIHELPCVPEHLRYEMYRTQTQEDRKERNLHNGWMDLVVIDCQPFLFYLQFLLYRQMGRHKKQESALINLYRYIFFTKLEDSQGHLETAFNVAGHCWELENRPDLAWKCYQWSIRLYPNNNAAWVHLIRLFQKYFLWFTETNGGWWTLVCVKCNNIFVIV